jgi:hypothetical protein
MNISLSVRDFSDLHGQIEDALRFLSANRSELQRLIEFPGVESVEVDFPIHDRDVAVQSERFPTALISLLGELRIGLVVSHYPASSNSDVS